MATTGQKIEKSVFSSAWYQYWEDTHSNEQQKRYTYVCAPCWYLKIIGYDGWFSDTVASVDINYWNGNRWVYKATLTSKGPVQIAGHNREEGDRNIICDEPYPLWKFVYSHYNGKAGDWRIKIWAGGWGLTNRGTYPVGKHIYSIGRTGTNVNIHSAGTTDAGSPISGQLSNIFNYSNRSGAPILAGNENELVNYPYLP